MKFLQFVILEILPCITYPLFIIFMVLWYFISADVLNDLNHMIDLKRFNQGSYYRSKLSTLVEFPRDRLDLSPYAADNNGLYNL